MSDNVESVVLEQLRRLNGKFDRFELELGDMKPRLASVEDHLASVVMSAAGLNSRLDRMDGRVARIERRLELTDANDAR